ncbi:MAG: vWA domain-containing protein [Gammaproteobacteria bacterium]
MHFARVLRRCGLPLGPGKVLEAVEAVQAVGISDRSEFYWTLHAVFVNRYAHRELFDQAFHVFWRNPRLLEQSLSLLLPRRPADDEPHQELSRRVTEAMAPRRSADRAPHERTPRLEFDAQLTWSDRERLQHKDFEQMSDEEMEAAKRAIATMRLALESVPMRRLRNHPSGRRIDMRATLRANLRGGHGGAVLIRAQPRERPPALVLLCDISGSMARYSRMLLHFSHAVTNDRNRVHTFVFGTRTTNITRFLQHKDVDIALENVAGAVEDWSGGTRIGRCLHTFNREWSRRVLGQGAVVLLITDGLDRDTGAGLSTEMERLHKSCRRLIWLNPLLRYDRFEPKALGMQAMLPHVDEFKSAHNLASIKDLVTVLCDHGVSSVRAS